MPYVPLKKQFTDVFNAYAAEGALLFEKHQTGEAAVLSHVCFKFSSQEAYADYVAAAHEIGTVSQEEFGGKQITWVRLAEPLEQNGLKLEWLEIVEPKTEKQAFNGVANIGYAVPSLPAAVKLQSADEKMLFRYQSQHAKAMARQ